MKQGSNLKVALNRRKKEIQPTKRFLVPHNETGLERWWLSTIGHYAVLIDN